MLLASAELNGTPFERALIYLVSHGDEGSMGVIVNQPLKKITFGEIAKSMGIEEMMAARFGAPEIIRGGPVEHTRGFVLHTGDYALPTTVSVASNISLSASAEIVTDIAHGRGPRALNFCLGYAGWAAGQLEEELHGNGWLLLPGDEGILFDVALEKRYNAATQKLGLTALNFHTDITARA